MSKKLSWYFEMRYDFAHIGMIDRHTPNISPPLRKGAQQSKIYICLTSHWKYHPIKGCEVFVLSKLSSELPTPLYQNLLKSQVNRSNGVPYFWPNQLLVVVVTADRGGLTMTAFPWPTCMSKRMIGSLPSNTHSSRYRHFSPPALSYMLCKAWNM